MSRQRLTGLAVALERQKISQLEQRGKSIGALKHLLRVLSPEGTLERGYSVIRDAEGDIIRSVATVKPGDLLEVQLRDGKVSAGTKAVIPKSAS